MFRSSSPERAGAPVDPRACPPVAQAGDVDSNGDLVDLAGELLEFARWPWPVRLGVLRSAIATGSVIDVDEHLLLVAREVARAQGTPYL